MPVILIFKLNCCRIVAITFLSLSIVMVTGLVFPLKSPLQPVNTWPESEATVKVISVPALWRFPGGSMVMLPGPFVLTSKEYWRVKFAVTALLPSMVMV